MHGSVFSVKQMEKTLKFGKWTEIKLKKKTSNQ